jgi:hypothetical protein
MAGRQPGAATLKRSKSAADPIVLSRAEDIAKVIGPPGRSRDASTIYVTCTRSSGCGPAGLRPAAAAGPRQPDDRIYLKYLTRVQQQVKGLSTAPETGTETGAGISDERHQNEQAVE